MSEGGNAAVLLARGLTLRSSSNWERDTIEAVGNEIRVTDNEALLLRVTDNTYQSGKIFFSAFGLATMFIYNLDVVSISAITRTPAAPTNLPFSTGFNDLEARDGVLQNPNIDLLEGSQGFINHPARPQKDGSQGNILRLTGAGNRSTLELAGIGNQSDFRLEFDLKGGVYDHVVAFRATDVDNGYQFAFGGGTVRLYKLAGGNHTLLDQGPTGRPSSAWGRYAIEAIGDEITVTDGDTLLLEVTDVTYGSGKIHLSAFTNAVALIDNLLVDTPNSQPIAVAGSAQGVLVCNTAQLNGTGSSDPDFDPITYAWTLVNAPAGSNASLDGSSNSTTTLSPDEPGQYVVQLIVNDGKLDSSPDQVTITASAPELASGVGHFLAMM